MSYYPHFYDSPSQDPYLHYRDAAPQYSPFKTPTGSNSYPTPPRYNDSPLPYPSYSYDTAAYPSQSPFQYGTPSHRNLPLTPYVALVAALPPQSVPSLYQWLSNPSNATGTNPYQAPETRTSHPNFPHPFALHLYLDAEAPGRSNYKFNLASPFFSPTVVVDGQPAPLATEPLSQLATDRPLYHLRIVCDEISEWPIDIGFDPKKYYEQTGMVSSYYPPPINLGDTLSQIHKTLHTRITHRDWDNLDTGRRFSINQAYQRRCASVPGIEQAERDNGVLKVDYLLKKVWFKGLVRTNEGPETLKLIVSTHD